MKQIHPIQLQILRKLLFSKSLKYTELKPETDMENNQFSFHLDQMIGEGYVTKDEKLYSLTSTGKEFANRMDTDKIQMAKQAKVSAFVIPVKEVKGKETEYLIYTRLKHPFYGCQGFMSGKVMFGEKITIAAERELHEETNLVGSAEVIYMKHFLVYDKKTNQLLKDKLCFYNLVKNPIGTVYSSEEGKYEWVKESELFKYVTNHFESLDEFKRDIKRIKNFSGNVEIEEIIHITDAF